MRAGGLWKDRDTYLNGGTGSAYETQPVSLTLLKLWDLK